LSRSHSTTNTEYMYDCAYPPGVAGLRHNKAMELTGRGRWRAEAGGRRPPQYGG
jgi:hypothetical protein